MPDKKTFRVPFPKTGLEFTGERFTTLAEGEIRHEHFHRYFFALQFCAGKSVLDAACGEGYGSALLATVAKQVIGVDSAEEAIRHATENYLDHNLTFQVGEATLLPVRSGSIDVVISFETLEHLSEHEQFLAEIKRVLCPGGLLVMSTPNHDFFAGSPPNPFHLKELRRPEFRGLMEQVFRNSALFVQSSLMGSVIADCNEGTHGKHEGFGRVRDNLFESAPGLPSGMYMIGIASDAKLPEIRTGSFDDRQFQLGLYAELQRRHIGLLRGEADLKNLREEIRLSSAREAESHAELLRLREIVLRDETELTNLREEIRLSSARDAEGGAELLRMREALLRLEGEAGYLRNAQAATCAQEIELQVELRRREEEKNLREGTILILQNEIDRLRKQETEWRRSEQQLRPESGLINQEREREASLSQMNEESRRFRGEVERLEEEINTLRIRESEAKSEVQRMRDYQSRLDAESAAALASLTSQRDGYRQKIAERDLEIESVKHSLSWAISAPFRWIGIPLAKICAVAVKLMYCTPAYRYTGKPLARLLSGFSVPGAGWLLPANPLFDAQFYRTRYPDAAKGSRNLWAHYLSCGDDESRNPHPLFQTAYYKLRNPDVTAAGINSLMHYFEHGAREGRDPSPDFDTSYYRERYPDVDESGVNPLLHFRLHGAAEGRRPVRGSPLKARILQPLQVSKSLNEIVPAAPAPTGERREPLISVIMPTFNTPRRYLLLAIESVLRQSYQGWQLCIYDDGSSAAETLELLKEYRGRDSRIRVQFGSRNQGIGAASNQAMAFATGRYVAMLDHDDVIVPEALLEIANVLNGDPAIDALYTDQAYVEADGSCVQPFFKPDWSPEMFRGVMFVNHLLAVRRTLAMDLGGFDTRFDRAQDFEFMLRVSEKSVKIHHLPKVLYHWRRIQGSVAFHGDQKGAIEPIQAAAVNAHLKRINIPAIAEPHPTLAHRLTIKPAPRKSAPSVLVVVRDATASDSNPECLSSILVRSTYSNFQVLWPRLLHSVNAAQDPRVMIGDTGIRKYGTADYLVWIDSDLELLTPDWIEHLLLYCEQPQIACATPLILNRDGAVWDAGLVLGMNGLIGYPMRGLPADSDGYAGSLSCAREVTCASGACMMVSRQRLEALGDLVEYYQDSLYQGADLSLRAATAGFRNIVNPRVTLRRLDNSSAAEGCELDRELFKDRWGAIAKYGDRYYNPNFKLISPGYQTAETAMAAAV